MNYKETKAMLELCARSLSYHGCDPIANEIELAIETLDYAHANQLIK